MEDLFLELLQWWTLMPRKQWQWRTQVHVYSCRLLCPASCGWSCFNSNEGIRPIPPEQQVFDPPADFAHPAGPALQPIEITQPKGPSFVLEGHHVQWQGWDLRIGFNAREGEAWCSLFWIYKIRINTSQHPNLGQCHQRSQTFDLQSIYCRNGCTLWRPR